MIVLPELMVVLLLWRYFPLMLLALAVNANRTPELFYPEVTLELIPKLLIRKMFEKVWPDAQCILGWFGNFTYNPSERDEL